MKKIISFLTMAAVMLSLVGCDKANVDNSNSEGISDSSSGTIGTTEQSAPVGGDSGVVPAPSERAKLTELTSSAGVHFDAPACAAENGLYYMEPVRIGRYNGYLMYIDYATKQETYVCADSSCKHDTERCTSYFSYGEFFIENSSKMFVYDGSLFYLSIDYDRDGQISSSSGDKSFEERKQALYRMNFDGSGRQRVFTFDERLTVEPFAAGDGDCLWFSVKTPVLGYNEKAKMYYADSKDRALIRISLSDYNIVEQIPLKNNDNLARLNTVGCSDNEFVFLTTEYPEGVTREDVYNIQAQRDPTIPFTEDTEEDRQLKEIDKNSSRVFYALDRTDKEFREIYGYPYEYSGCTYYIYNNDLYIWKFSDNSFSVINTASGEPDTQALAAVEGYNPVSVFGGRYVCNSPDPDDPAVYYIDPETKEIGSSELKSPEEPNYPIYFSAVAVGNEYVLIRGEGIPLYNKHNGIAGYYYNYFVMTIDDFFNGVDNLEPVKIIERE